MILTDGEQFNNKICYKTDMNKIRKHVFLITGRDFRNYPVQSSKYNRATMKSSWLFQKFCINLKSEILCQYYFTYYSFYM